MCSGRFVIFFVRRLYLCMFLIKCVARYLTAHRPNTNRFLLLLHFMFVSGVPQASVPCGPQVSGARRRQRPGSMQAHGGKEGGSGVWIHSCLPPPGLCTPRHAGPDCSYLLLCSVSLYQSARAAASTKTTRWVV